MYYLEMTLRIMHILGAVILLGSILFQRFALLPALRELESDELAEKVRQLLRGRIAKLTMYSAALLLLSGLVNTARVSIQYRFPDGDYNLLLAVKLLLAMMIFYVASALAGRSAAAEKLRANATKWLNLLLAASVLILVLGAAMKQSAREPKGERGIPAASSSGLDEERVVPGPAPVATEFDDEVDNQDPDSTNDNATTLGEP